MPKKASKNCGVINSVVINKINILKNNIKTPFINPKPAVSRKKMRARAYRRLKGKVPPGWKLRLSFKYIRFYKKGLSVADNQRSMSEALASTNFFVTATKNLGSKKEDGMPYVKCFIHPSQGRSWSLSNWSSLENFHKAAHVMISVSEKEMERVFECMEALAMLMSTDPLVEINGFAKSASIEKWSQ